MDRSGAAIAADRGKGSAGLVGRERLLRALDDAVTRRATLIAAPAGSGKTSLLRTWIERSRDTHRVAYVSARSDEDEQLFWLALLAAIRGALGSGEPAEAPAPTPAFDAAVLVDRILSELAERREPVVLVIDDLHELGGPEALEQVARLLAELRPEVHAVLATRRDLRLGTHQLRLAGELAEIRAANLQFTEGETRELLARSGVDLPEAAVRTLLQRTEGWAAGLRLAALSLAVEPDPERFVAEFSGSDRAVADYLLAEMLERQPPQVQQLLLRTSILERVNGKLADLVAETSGSDHTLLGLEDANAFVISLDAERTWFRYHRLFRDLLRLELRRTTPAVIPDLHRRAARWFSGHGDPVDAIRHTQAAGDWPLASQLLADNVFGLLLEGQSRTMRRLLGAFPRGAFDSDPELALVHAAQAIMQGRFPDVAANLDIADRYVEALPPERQPRLKVGIASLRLALATRVGQFDDVVGLVSVLESPETARWSAQASSAADLHAVALMSLGIAETWSARGADAERHLEEGAALAHTLGRPYLEMACLANLGFASAARSLEAARRHSEEAIALAERHGWEAEHMVAPALVTLGGILVWAGDFASGEHWLRRAATLISPGADPPVELLLHLATGLLYAAKDSLPAGLDELEAAQRIQSRFLGRHALAGQVTGWTVATYARLGDLDRARDVLAALPDGVADSGEIHNAAAVVSLEAGEPEAALTQLRDVLDGTLPTIHDVTLVEAQLLAAHAHQALSRDGERNAAVESALGLAEGDRLILPFAMTRSRELLEAVPRHATAHAWLRQEILDLLQGSPSAASAVSTPLLTELSPSELRVLRYLPTNLTRSDIARELYLSVNTVNTHVRNIYWKLGVRSRSEAVERARRLRLLSRSVAPHAAH